MAERIPFRGGLTCSCVVESLPWVEKELQTKGLLKGQLRVFQWGYRGDVSASAGTHDRGGCIDVDATPTAAEIDVWRLWGWTMQNRAPFFQFDHCHGWPYKCTHLSPAAQQQERDWDNRDAGLSGPGKVQGRWPVDPWYVALAKRKPLFEDEGFPLMAGNSTPIQFANKDQDLAKTGYVHINADKHSSVVQGESDGVECVASVEVAGLQAGEFVKIWWHRVWKKTGADDSGRSSEIADYANPAEPTAHVMYADKLAKADTGWTACLRVKYETNSSTAKFSKATFNGWKIT